MTTLSDRPNTALVVIDVQNGVVANAHQRDDVIGNISTLVDRARAEDVPVIWVQHTSDELPQGSDQWQYVDELQQSSPSPSSTSGTATRSRTRSSRSSRRASAASSSRARRPTSASGRPCTARSCAATTPSSSATPTRPRTSEWGAPTPDKVISHTNMYWKFHTAPGRTAEVVETSDVRFDSSEDDAADENAPEGEGSS